MKKSIILLLLLFLVINSSGNSVQVDHPQTILSQQQAGQYSKLKQFLNASQDTGEFIVSMDQAFYKAKSFTDLQFLSGLVSSESEGIILDFIANLRNQDGGYGNWKGSVSSMESTFQAISILNVYDRFDSLTTQQLQDTWAFISSLKTTSGGYYPLVGWDAPDMTSTSRAIQIHDILASKTSISLPDITNDSLTYAIGNFVPPFFINDGSGYSENTNGSAEIIATNYAYDEFRHFNYTDSRAELVAKFLNTLSSSNGGFANDLSSIPTAGYTSQALDLYFKLTKQLDTTILTAYFNTSRVQHARDYLVSLKESGFGFTSSSRDQTSGISSTMFVLDSLVELSKSGYPPGNLNFKEVFDYLIKGKQPSYGIGDNPADKPNIEYVSYALELGDYINDQNWISAGLNTFIDDCYDVSGAFGYRPHNRPRVKYTYYGVTALRLLGNAISQRSDIINYLLSSQNPDGGFGEQPGSQLSYLTHTYWAIETLLDLDYDFSADFNQTLSEFLRFYQRFDGSFSNYPGFNTTILSSYRGYKIIKDLDFNYSTTEFAQNFDQFKAASGGFYFSSSSTRPSMEATYYGVLLADLLGLDLNKTKTLDFVNSLKNNDGGYGPKSGFSSKISSSLQAIQILDYLEENTTNVNLQDNFAPWVQPSFNEHTDTNKTIIRSYKLYSQVDDRESGIAETWVEVVWDHSNTIEDLRFDGKYSHDADLWYYNIGPLNDQGNMKFRVHALDFHNNSAMTKWFYLKTLAIDQPSFVDQFKLVDYLWLLPVIMIAMSSIDGIIAYNKSSEEGDIRMEITKDTPSISKSTSFNTLYLVIFLSVLVFLARLFLNDTLLILQQSLFLFRFLLAAVFILIVRYVLGLRTFGFFGTSVLALSYFAIGPIWGTLIFLNVFTLSYILRKLIEPYHLAVGFRIGLIMMIVVMTLTVFEIIGEVFIIPFLTSSILLPIIITPWMADRYVQEELEDSSLDAFIRLCLTIAVITGSYLVMSIDAVVKFIIFNPETWLLFFGVLIFLGRSRAHTWIDRRRFHRLFDTGHTPLSLLSRNRDYIAKYNQKLLFPIIDKFNLKDQFDKWHVPTAQLYAVLSRENDIDPFIERTFQEEEFANGFVIKPSNSFGGRGIVVVKGITDNGTFLIGSEQYHGKALIDHIRKIMQGEFLTSQTTGQNDVVLIEELIIPDEDFGALGYGLADIRVIVFRGIPVMCMARVPTKASEGLANLKQGAIGAAISIETGIITRAEYKRNPITIHPDTGMKLPDFKFDNWTEILAVACLAQKSTALGYAGIDIVLDNKDRVLVLEANKRPGLEIQNINLSALLHRLEYIEEHNLSGDELSPLGAAKLGIKLSQLWQEDALNE